MTVPLRPEADVPLRLYWRPGCPFCARLRWGLRRRAVPMEEVNIGDDPEAAALGTEAPHLLAGPAEGARRDGRRQSGRTSPFS